MRKSPSSSSTEIPYELSSSVLDGRVVTDNASELLSGATALPSWADVARQCSTLTTNQPVGHVYVDVNHELPVDASRTDFLNTLLFYVTGIGGLLTVGIGILSGRLAIQAYHCNPWRS